MKTIKFLALASIVAGAMAVQSCNRAEIDTPAASGEKITAVLSVSADAETKAVADNDGFGESVKRCIIQVRMDGQVYEQKTIDGTTGHYETSIDLINGQKYDILAWVDGGEGYYTLGADGVVKSCKDVINDDAADAFFGTASLDLSATTDTKVTILATRPFAQLNLITSDLKENFLPKSISVKFKAPKSFDLINGTFGDSEEFSASVTDLYKDYSEAANTAVMAYVFAGAEEKTILEEIELGAEFEGSAHRIIPNIPVQQNYRTNVTGKLFTNNGSIIVDVVPGWGEPANEMPQWDGSIAPVPEKSADGFIHITSASELAGLAKDVNDGKTTFAGKTIVLDNDIDLSNCPWTPIGGLVSYPSITFEGTFDGQNHVISNLNATDNTPNYACAGLFGSTLGTVKNLTLKNVKVSSTHYAGAVVAYSSSSASVVENCHVDGGTITSTIEWLGTEYDNGDKVGGIFGLSAEGAPISGCSVKNVTIRGYRDLGGIAGRASGTLSNNIVENVTILQDNTNGYKSSVTTFGEIEGSGAATLSGNTFINVTIKSITSASTQAELNAAVAGAAAGAEIFVAAGTYTVPDIPQNITISGEDGVVFNCAGSGSIASIPNGATFENVTLDFGANQNYHGFQHAGTINMNGCTLKGLFFSYGDMNFSGCHFVQETGEYNMWAYGMNLTFTDCVFDSCGKFINVFNEGSTPYNVTCEGCTFNTSTVNKPALNIKATSGANALHHEVVINNCSANFTIGASTSDSKVVGSALWQVDDINASVDSSNKVTVDGVVVYDAK